MRRVVCAVLLVLWAAGTAAQEVGAPGPGERGPRFYAAAPGAAALVPVEASKVAVLRQRITLDLTGATLRQALETISRRAKLRINYSASLVPLDLPVTIQARNLTIAAVLTEVLLDAGVDVVVMPSGQLTLRKQTRQAVGTIVGRVTDGKTGGGLANAEVLLEGARWRTATGEDGRFRLADVVPGNYTLTVRRVGYGKQSRAIAVAEGAEVTVEVALQPVATQLDEIVTTVTGEQRIRELGHVVGRINADSVVKEAPVSSLSELLNGRVPGLQVFTHSGQVGGKVALQVRSPNSIYLSTEPIVIVDGVRYQSGASTGGGPFAVEQTSRLNDLNPNDIESIEVVKGPSAATLYGTDAANGVLVITTKRGRSGPARWHAYARATTKKVPPERYPEVWWGWRTVGGVPSRTSNCRLWDVAQSTCVQDSVTVLANPSNDPAQTMFGSKPSWEYGANVSGGRPDFRYYVSGDAVRAIGPIQLSPEAVEQLEARRGVAELPEEQREPNAATALNLRANVTAALGSAAELRLQTGYGHHAARTLAFGSLSYRQAALGTPAEPYGDSALEPEQLFAATSTERVDRFFGGATGQWQAAAWLQARGTVGLDLASSTRYSLARRGESLRFASGTAGDDRTRQLGITADLGFTALVRYRRLSFRTAVGGQYVRSVTNALTSLGTDLPPGGESVGQAATRNASQSYSETVTLGSYLEETLGLNERLYVTGALRVDGGSAFGRDYEVAAYPKASVSWLLSEEPFLPHLPGVGELRLRYAFGASGQQARSHMTLPAFDVSQATLDGTVTNRVRLSSLGNPELRPERVREHEVGLDASGLAGRLRLGLTWFRRTTIDQILIRSLPPGYGTVYTNLGRVSGRGFEAELTARLVETPFVSWQVSLSHALRRSRVMELGDASSSSTYLGGYVKDSPLGARFAPQVVGYADANGDGILVANEVQLGAPVYLGESTPPRTQILTTAVGLFGERLRLSALFERRSGFVQVDELRRSQCQRGLCRAAVDPTTPLAIQAEVVANTPPVEPGDFTRFRELTAALELPVGLLRAVRLRSATLALAVRNLALWTAFGGPDPESAQVDGYSGGVANAIPQTRTWMVRVDLGL